MVESSSLENGLLVFRANEMSGILPILLNGRIGKALVRVEL